MKQTPNEPALLSLAELKKTSQVLHAVNHPLRLKIVQFVHKKELITVTEISTKMKLGAAATSQHLAILRNADVLQTKRQGVFIHYSVNQTQLKRIQKMVAALNGA